MKAGWQEQQRLVHRADQKFQRPGGNAERYPDQKAGDEIAFHVKRYRPDLVSSASRAGGAGGRRSSGFTLRGRWRFFARGGFRLRAVLEIGSVPTVALQLKTRSGDKFGIRVAAACGTSRYRRIVHLLQIFLFKTTGPATVFINRHDNLQQSGIEKN